MDAGAVRGSRATAWVAPRTRRRAPPRGAGGSEGSGGGGLGGAPHQAAVAAQEVVELVGLVGRDADLGERDLQRGLVGGEGVQVDRDQDHVVPRGGGLGGG